MKAIILLSGGIDSMACINFYMELGYEVECVFCDYGQPAREQEYTSAKQIAQLFNKKIEFLLMTDIDVQPEVEIIGRNALLALQVLAKYKIGCYKIVIGIHSGSMYTDCTIKFLKIINDIIDLYTNGQVVCEAPFIQWTKPDIIKYSKDKRLPINLTYSCERGTVPPCGKCPSCTDRKVWLNES